MKEGKSIRRKAFMTMPRPSPMPTASVVTSTGVLPEGEPVGPGRNRLHYKIEEGIASFLERINIIGNTRTKDKVIRREILVAPGDVFNTVRVDIRKTSR